VDLEWEDVIRILAFRTTAANPLLVLPDQSVVVSSAPNRKRSPAAAQHHTSRRLVQRVLARFIASTTMP
jgi:hypothetical protein